MERGLNANKSCGGSTRRSATVTIALGLPSHVEDELTVGERNQVTELQTSLGSRVVLNPEMITEDGEDLLRRRAGEDRIVRL